MPSDPVGHSRWFWLSARPPLRWNSYDDLSGRENRRRPSPEYRGTGRPRQQGARRGSCPRRAQGLLKLAAGRVDAAVIDLNVFNYLVKNDASVKAVAGPLQVNAKFLESQALRLLHPLSGDVQRARPSTLGSGRSMSERCFQEEDELIAISRGASDLTHASGAGRHRRVSRLPALAACGCSPTSRTRCSCFQRVVQRWVKRQRGPIRG